MLFLKLLSDIIDVGKVSVDSSETITISGR